MNTKENNPISPINAAKTSSSGSEGNPTRKLEEAIMRAFIPYIPYPEGITADNMALIDAHHWLISTMRGQVDVFQTLASEITPSTEQIQIRAGSLVGLTECLINQLDALEALTDGLCDQIHELKKERDQALEAFSFVKKGGAL